MKRTSAITLFLSLCILGSTLSSCQIVGGYLFEKITDCAVLNDCPPGRTQRNFEPRPNVIRRPPAEQAVRDYYRNINNYYYQIGWKSLSPQLRQNSKFHPQGYNSYTNWWTKVKRVDVLSTYRISANPYSSTVDTRLRYLMSSDREIDQTLRFYLIWDRNTNCWLINNIERL